jgi:SPP1 family predicted phage head-tail adaptor
MQAGRLRHRITISRVTKTQNASGEDVTTLAELGSFAAEVLPLVGKEAEAHRQLWSEAGHVVTMRYQPSIVLRREDRITWGTRSLDIADIQQSDGKLRDLRLICREITQ